MDLEGNSLSLTSGPNFTSASAGSPEGTISVNETASYTATYTITQSEVDAGGISYSATVSGTSPDGNTVSDISDNGINSDGNTENDATEIVIEFNPLIISEYHILNADGDPQIKYYFDDSGQIDKIFYSDNRTYDFEFDSEQKLVNIIINDENGILIESSSVSYDSQHRVTSIGDRQFEFVEGNPDYYIDLETFYENNYTYGDSEYTDIQYARLSTLYTCNYFYDSEYNTVTQELMEYSYCLGFDAYSYNGNVDRHCNDSDCTYFSHDFNINPLYSTTNLIYLNSFLSFPFSEYYSSFFYLFSQNNLTLINYGDPSSDVYNYIFNTNNLPVSSTRQHRDASGPQPEVARGNYYYQGDDIPN
jgi:hypothetical protein